MDKLKLLRAVYESIGWDELYRRVPEADREQVDELFRELTAMLAERPEPPEELAARLAGGEAWLYCDGASKGNPGPAGIGMVLATLDGQEVLAWGAPLGRATNNVAEYRAAIAGLERALALGVRRVRLLSDSELLVRQISGRYKVKHPGLRPLHAEVIELLQQFESYEVAHVAREKNARADALAARYAKAAKRREQGDRTAADR